MSRESVNVRGSGNYTAVFETIYSVSPNYHITKIGEHLLSPYRPWGDVQETPILNSLINAGPNVLALAIVNILFFIASYITFTRQEIR